ncbi:Thioredoxin-like protein AAED1, chloroplastic [Apostasia shenzhenica]|uniref:Peroxiredoxin-like 2A n=1 Tax=Apostasia shenzhenica TaxID=1088818 RepID=A0A2I0AJU3_9ASPA|nr:Thioredoxin-like protein AAED1, chloroplastic [Apostasia shenzhenica]
MIVFRVLQSNPHYTDFLRYGLIRSWCFFHLPCSETLFFSPKVRKQKTFFLLPPFLFSLTPQISPSFRALRGRRMASFAMEEFVGEGVLKGLIPKFVAAGWDDVPTLKMMINSENMDLLKLNPQQKNALELRSHLHDRSLMLYADRLEASRASLPELLGMNTVALSSQFSMKRGHVARFINKEIGCRMPSSCSYLPPSGKSLLYCTTDGCNGSCRKDNLHRIKSHLKLNPEYDGSISKAVMDLKVNEGHVFKGIVAAKSTEPRLCGCIKPPPIVDDVVPFSVLGNIPVQKLTPEYKVGVEHFLAAKAPAMKASELWVEKPTVLLCIRRPGCIMCRAEAHQLYSRKPMFDALGFQLIAVLHEQLESEVKEFWPRYWGGTMVVDSTMGFFRALGGGKLLKENFFTGFLLNPQAMANFKQAKATGFEYNFKGEGEIKGGVIVVRRGREGVAYQFIERNFGDWAPIAEVVEICSLIHEKNFQQIIEEPQSFNTTSKTNIAFLLWITEKSKLRKHSSPVRHCTP